MKNVIKMSAFVKNGDKMKNTRTDKPLYVTASIIPTNRQHSISKLNNNSSPTTSLYHLGDKLTGSTKGANNFAKNTQVPVKTFAVEKPNSFVLSSTEMLSSSMTIKFPIKGINIESAVPNSGPHSSPIAVPDKTTVTNTSSSIANNFLIEKSDERGSTDVSVKHKSAHTTRIPDTFEQRIFPLLKKFDTKLEYLPGNTYNVPQNYNSDLISSLASALIMCVFLVSIFYYLIGKSKSNRRFWSSGKSRKIVQYLGPRRPAVLNEEELAYHFQTTTYQNETQLSTTVSIPADSSEPLDERGKPTQLSTRKTIIQPSEMANPAHCQATLNDLYFSNPAPNCDINTYSDYRTTH